MRTEPEVAEYFAAARDWDQDRAQAERRSARRAWLIAGVASAVALTAVAAVAALTPLKSVEPFVIRVDNASGVVDVVPALDGKAAESEVVARYLLTQYVITRERFVPSLAEADYETVGAFHTPLMNQAWAAAWNRNNPDSPLNVHADGSAVRVTVNAVSFLEPTSGRRDLAQVRFVRSSGDVSAAQERQYVATLQYAFGEPSKDDRLRAANPLGFKVLEYRREPEIVAPVVIASTPAMGVAP
jgi:type IV secretion system protein VirB8